MNTHRALSIFRAGRHLDQSGTSLVFTEADLQATAQGYDSTLHEAPLVIGHPSQDAPAYGWVETLSLEGEILHATPKQVDPAFAELVANGRFKKISASFYLPTSPRNPKPGIYYLRHVGFLGAQPPAVKGLADAAFADEPADSIVTIEFSDLSPASQAGLWQRMRTWIALRFGQEEAEQALPASFLAIPHDPPATTPAALQLFSEPEGVRSEKSPALSQPDISQPAPASLDFAEREARLAQAETALRLRHVTEFVERQAQEGRILPRDVAPLTAFLVPMALDETVSFSELVRHQSAEADPTSDRADDTPLVWFLNWLVRQPIQIDYSERTVAPSARFAPDNLHIPPGYAVDPARLDLHQRAQAYARTHNLDYQTAVKALSHL